MPSFLVVSLQSTRSWVENAPQGLSDSAKNVVLTRHRCSWIMQPMSTRCCKSHRMKASPKLKAGVLFSTSSLNIVSCRTNNRLFKVHTGSSVQNSIITLWRRYGCRNASWGGCVCVCVGCAYHSWPPVILLRNRRDWAAHPAAVSSL